MVDLIFFAALAAFVIYRLFTTLGKDDGVDIKSFVKVDDVMNSFKDATSQAKDANFEVISALEAGLPDNIKQVFETIRQKDMDFNAKTFVDGAKKAFEMIVIAFYKNDTAILKELLDSQVYQSFLSDINNRLNSKLTHEVTLVGTKDVQIIDANTQGEIASIKVKIESEQIKVIKDQNQNLISGNVNQILQLVDIWTFSKDISSGDYWKLIGTGSQ
jgi:predicted lipid-binding transport protein (Tim44 family)